MSNSTQIPKRASFLTAPVDAANDIRKICNGLKRSTILAAASALTGADYETLTKQVDDISEDIIVKLGLSSSDKKNAAIVLAIISEPVAMTLTDAVLLGANKVDVANLSKNLVDVLTTFARSKVVSTQLASRYPLEIDAITALRMSSAAALSLVALEVANNDFGIGYKNCMKEAAKQINAATFNSVDTLAGEHATVASKTMLTQSLFVSAGKLYSACYRSISEGSKKYDNQIDGMNAIDKAKEAKDNSSMKFLEIAEKFNTMFSYCVEQFEIPLYLKPKSSDVKVSGARP